MKIKNVSLDIVCGVTSTLPQTGRLEVAFAGKSNVGKSSLINGLMNRKALARTSSEPGKTQTINFYNVNNKVYLVSYQNQIEKRRYHRSVSVYHSQRFLGM